jgi:dTMP kinase
LIVFEGPEGAGKSTQARLLAAELRRSGYGVVLTREPGGTALGERIRSLLLRDEGYAMLAETEALLHAAARSQHVGEVIDPALAAGRIVVCDRFVDSSFAYQGGGLGVPREELRAVQKLATRGVMPDLRLLLDLPAVDGLARRLADRDGVNRIDEAGLPFHELVRSAYLDLARDDPGGWVRLDATGSVETVAGDVAAAVHDRLGARLALLPREEGAAGVAS